MVLIKEFRIVMPMTMEEYEVGFMYTIMKMEQKNTTGREGVEVLQNVPFEDDKLGKGHYTSKVYHLQSKVPSWLKTFAPHSALSVQEESWNSFHKAKTVLKCPYFHQCLLTIETVNKADNGCSENALGLSDEQLALRQVEMIDISSVGKDYWSRIIGSTNTDFSVFTSQKTGRGPLRKGWQVGSKPVMTTYKVVMMDAPIWGIGSRMEEAIIAGERALFLECHRLCFSLIDEWFGLTMEQIKDMEKENDVVLNKRLQKTPWFSRRKELPGKTFVVAETS